MKAHVATALATKPVREAPNDPNDLAEDSASRRSDPNRRTELYLDRVASERKGRRRAHHLLELARYFLDEVNDLDRALTALLAAYRERPHRRGWAELHRLAAATRRWDELASTLTSTIENLPVRDRGDAWVHVGHIHELWLGDAERAAACYRRSVAEGRVEEGDGAALERVERRRPTQKREEARALAEAGERAAAIARYQELRGEAPADAELLRALARLYAEEGAVDDRLRVLGELVGIVEERQERAALYREMASVHESCGAAARAAECLEWVLSFEPRDEDAYRALERLYLEHGRFRAAIDAFCRHAEIVEAAARDEIFLQVAELYEDELRDRARAIDFCLKAERLPSAQAMLTRLYEEEGAHEALIELYERRAQAATLPRERAACLCRAAELAVERFADDEVPAALFERAREADGTHAPSLLGLASFCEWHHEVGRAAQLYEQALAVTLDGDERRQLLARVGSLREELGEREAALAAFREVLALDANDETAMSHLARLLEDAGLFAEALPLCERLAARAASPTQADDQHRLARVAAQLGDEERALEAYRRVVELDADCIEAQAALGGILYRRGLWAQASRALRAVLEARDALATDEEVELFLQLATCAHQLGADGDARKLAEAGLALDPQHAGCLELRGRLLVALGEQACQADGDRAQALQAFRAALAIRPDDHKLLYRYLELLVEERAWEECLEVLARLARSEKDPLVRARYRQTAGLIMLEELARPELAMNLLEAALDDDPTAQRAADAVESLLRGRSQHVALKAHYCRMLKRLGPDARDGKRALRLTLWRALAELCLGALDDRESGLAALEVVLELDPGDGANRARLADLYVAAGAEHVERAIAEHQRVLKNDRGRLASCRALEELYLQAGKPDRAAACAQARLVLERRAAGEPLTTDGEPPPFRKSERHLDATAWAQLRHPDEDRYLAALFATVAPALLSLEALPASGDAIGLGDATRVEPTDPRPFARALHYAAQVAFAQPPPECWVRSAQRAPALVHPARDQQRVRPVIVVGLPLLGDRRPEHTLVFQLARQLAYLTPDRLLRLTLPEAHLQHVVQAAMALGSAEVPAQLANTVKLLESKLSPLDLDQVTTIGECLREAEVKPAGAVRAWLLATDLTAVRVAYALSGDLVRSAQLVPDEAVVELAWSSVTDELATVRAQLALD